MPVRAAPLAQFPPPRRARVIPMLRFPSPRRHHPPRKSRRMSKPVYDKPSHNKDKNKTHRDAELIQSQRTKHKTTAKAAERQSHLMKCPRCGAQLVETER